jgi:hypothetical protein
MLIFPSVDPLQVIFALAMVAVIAAGWVIRSEPLRVITQAVWAASRI